MQSTSGMKMGCALLSDTAVNNICIHIYIYIYIYIYVYIYIYIMYLSFHPGRKK